MFHLLREVERPLPVVALELPVALVPVVELVLAAALAPAVALVPAVAALELAVALVPVVAPVKRWRAVVEYLQYSVALQRQKPGLHGQTDQLEQVRAVVFAASVVVPEPHVQAVAGQLPVAGQQPVVGWLPVAG